MTVSQLPSRHADRGPAIVDLGPIRPRGRGAYKVTGAQPVEGEAAATTWDSTGLPTVLKAFAVTVLAVCVLGAQGITEQARTMPTGPAESVTMTVGNLSLGVQQFFGIGWPWRDLEVALGHGVQFEQSSSCILHPDLKSCAPARKHRNTLGGHKTRPAKGGRKHHKHKGMVHWPKLTVITKHRPLNIMVTGDSMPQYMVGQIAVLAESQGPVICPAPVQATTFPGTGLNRPDVFPWDVQARDETRQYHPKAVVVLMGGNDNQNMVLGNTYFIAGTKAWTREYQRRAEIVMRAFIDNGVKRVYWLSMPPPGDGAASEAHDFHQINAALKRAAVRVPGVHYVNIIPAVTYRGRYVDYKKVNGQLTLIRESDGIHLNVAGSQLVSDMVVPIIKREWHFGWKQVYERTHRHHSTSRHRRSRHKSNLNHPRARRHG